jgi:NitT/TauT family transport system substrate-binding protein
MYKIKNMKRIFFAMVVCTIIASCKQGTNKLTTVSLRQEWFPTANYAGELFAQYETGKKYGLNIRLDAGSDEIDPIKLVISGHNDFGIASADRILTANDKGAGLVVIAVANPNTPTCFLSRAEKNIKTPKDFENHTVGILTGTNTELIYKILKKKAGLDPSKIKEVEAPFDLATFIAGQYDVRPAFVYDEPVSLELKGIKYNMIKPADYGVNFLGTVYFTTAKMIKEKPEVVQAFVNSLADGWEDAFRDPKQAIRYLKKYDKDIDTVRESMSLQKAIPYFRGDNNKVLTCDVNKWNEMISSLKELAVLKNINLAQTVDTTFIHRYYEDKK